MQSNESIKVIHWNAQGITNISKRIQLENLLESFNIKICLLNETFLNPNHNFKLNNYNIIRKDRYTHGGGVAICIHKSLDFKQMPCNNNNSIETISVELTLNRRKIIFTSAYCPHYKNTFQQDLKKLTPPGKEFLVFGDLNAKHPAWNCSRSNLAGRILNDHQQLNNIYIKFPSTPTYYPHQSQRKPSTLDLLLSNSTLDISVETLSGELPSDHDPVVYNITANIKCTKQTYYDYKAADWETFQWFNDSKINNIVTELNTMSIDSGIKNLTSFIIEARDLSIPLKVWNNRSLNLSDTTKLCIGQRNRIKRQLQRCKDPLLQQTLKSLMNQVNSLISQNIINDRNRNWSDMLNKLRPGEKNFWKINKFHRGKGLSSIGVLKKNNEEIYDDEEKANIISDNFESSHGLLPRNGIQHTKTRYQEPKDLLNLNGK